MATTTTNNGWAIPQSTDLVKDGATAIATLGSAIDTTVGVYKNPGLVHINTTSFSAVASQSFNSVFSATYDNYKIILTTTSLTGGLTFRLRASGSDDSTSNYYSSALQCNWNADALVVAAGRQSGANIFNMYGSGQYRTFDLFNPNVNAPTSLFSSLSREGTTAWYLQGGLHNANYQADGFTIAATSVTGSVNIYGYRK